jgi:hypothetical protein
MRNLIMLLLIFAGQLALAQDFQSWIEVDLAATWHRIDFLVPLVARIDSQLPNPQLAAGGMSADLALGRHLTLTGGYLFADLPQKSLRVHLPLVALTNSFRIGRVTLADRNRFEKLFSYANSPIRYRNRFLVEQALGARGHLFATDEVIFDLTNQAWSQNRFQSGGGFRLNRQVWLDVYYLRRNGSGGAMPANVLGTNLRVSLTPPNHGR